MIPVSEHLHDRPYQVATSTDAALPLRKWNHRGTVYAPTHLSAAYRLADGSLQGARVAGLPGTVYRSSTGLFIHVGFGA